MYSVRRGQEFSIIYAVTTGTVTGAEDFRSVMKLTLKGRLPPGDAAAEALVFTSQFQADYTLPDATIADVWICTASAAQSVALAAGVYITDARFDAGAVVTRAVLIEVLERVTEPS